MAVGADMGAVLIEEVEAAAGEPALEQDAIRVVGAVVNLRVLREVGQDAAILNAGLDLSVERPIVQGLADGLLEAVEPLAPGGADGDRVVVMRPQDVEERAIGD